MNVRFALSGAAVALLLAASGCRTAGTAADQLPFGLTLEFEGEQSVDEARLTELVRRELVRLEVAVPDKAAVDDAAFALERFYRGRGYADVRVDYEFEPNPGGTPRARFLVTEGPQVRVRELALEGAAAFAPATVRGYFGDAARGGIYDDTALAAALESLREDYLGAGYLRIAVDEPVVEFDEARASVAVRVVLHEGPRFLVRAVEMEGGIPELAEREAKLVRDHVDVPYKPQFLPEIEHGLIEGYRRKGHPDVAVQVTPQFDETSGDVRIGVRIEPGDRVTLAHFRIQGNARTKDAAILEVVGIERGAVYDSEETREAFRKLYATGLFASVAIGLEGTGPERTLVIDVVETRSVEIRLEPGWGSYEGPRFLIGIQEKNFQGRGQIVEMEGTVSLKDQSLRLGWIDRNFLGTSFTSEISAFVEDRVEPSFEFVRRGLSFFLRRQLDDDWSTSFGYEYRPTNVLDDHVVAPLDEDTNVAAVSAVLTLDDRDNPLLPTRGQRGRARVELADNSLGSDTEFLRLEFDYARLLRLGERSVLSASARTGMISPFGRTAEIPVTERYFNGGENSVRSFREDELLPPGTSGEPQGGEAATTLNLELRQALAGNLGGALFFDCGNVTEQVQDYLDFAGFRAGLGVGLRYALPIGPMRLDFGVNPDPDRSAGEDEYVLHFSLGFPF